MTIHQVPRFRVHRALGPRSHALKAVTAGGKITSATVFGLVRAGQPPFQFCNAPSTRPPASFIHRATADRTGNIGS